MTDQFLAEIRLFPFDFPPKGWAFCDGQLLPISQNTALFSLLGTFYGGDGESTFALPDLQGSVLIQEGVSSQGSERPLGQVGGADTITLQISEMPFHTHGMKASSEPADHAAPAPDRALATSSPGLVYLPPNGIPTQLAAQATAISGSSLPHNNLMPTLTMQYCIALQGVFPQRP